jgi:hypothetical protein
MIQKIGLIFIALMLISFSVFAMEGTGTIEDPFQIRSCEDLQSVNQNLSANYSLGQNIDCSDTINWNDGNGFIPLGNLTTKFTGSLDGGPFGGQKFNITSLYINQPLTQNIGLFGYAQGAVIKNIYLIDSNIIGQSNVGGLIGTNNGTNISSIYSSGSIQGILGSSIGGIVGYNLAGNLSKSFTKGNVNGYSYLGGLIGRFQNGSISDSFSSANIKGVQFVGGLVGGTGAGNSTSISNAYSVGTVEGSSTFIGGLTGYSSGTTTRSYWNTQTSNQTTSSSGVGKTDEELQIQSTFESWEFSGINFLGIWTFNEIYPSLIGMDVYAPVLTQVTPVVTPITSTTVDTTVEYTFKSSENASLSTNCGTINNNMIAKGINTIQLNGLVVGEYNCTLTATDYIGKVGTLVMSPFTIEPIIPVLTQVTPVPTPFTEADVPIYYTFNTNVRGTLDINCGPIYSEDDDPWIYSIGDNMLSLSNLSDGIYNCVLTITDVAGNSGSLNMSPFVVDTVAPVLTQVTPVPTPLNSDTNIPYTFNTTEAGTLDINCGTMFTDNNINALMGNNTLIIPSLSDGIYNCVLTLTDFVGKKGTLNMSPFTIDTVAPVLTQLTPVPTPLDHTDNIYFNFNTTEAGTFDINCGPIYSEHDDQMIFPMGDNSLVIPSLSEGRYNCVLTLTDDANNAGSLNLTPFIIDIAPPVLTEVTPVPTPLNHNTNILYTFNASEAGTLDINCGAMFTDNNINALMGNNTLTFSGLKDGNYNCVLTITDIAEKKGSLNMTPFIVDSNAPVISYTTTGITTSTASINITSNEFVTLMLSTDGNWSNFVSDANGLTHAYPISGLTPATNYIYYILARDENGNEIKEVISFTTTPTITGGTTGGTGGGGGGSSGGAGAPIITPIIPVEETNTPTEEVTPTDTTGPTTPDSTNSVTPINEVVTPTEEAAVDSTSPATGLFGLGEVGNFIPIGIVGLIILGGIGFFLFVKK